MFMLEIVRIEYDQFVKHALGLSRLFFLKSVCQQGNGDISDIILLISGTNRIIRKLWETSATTLHM